MATILLVEDDSNLREIYGARLEAEGYKIASASDGEEALAASVRDKPDLIISDVMMPKISGFDMLDILRSTPETKNVKVIMMTALGQDEDRKRGEELGADRYLVKSQVTLEDVVNLVHQLLGDGGQKTPQAATQAQASDDSASTSDDSAIAQADGSDATTPQPADDQNVEDFVANSPLMNGTAPQTPDSDSSENLQ